MAIQIIQIQVSTINKCIIMFLIYRRQTHKMTSELTDILLNLFQRIAYKINVVVNRNNPLGLNFFKQLISSCCNTVILFKFKNTAAIGHFFAEIIKHV